MKTDTGADRVLPRRRLSPEASRTAALEAARQLLVEQGPQAVTLKAVAGMVGRTHANLLHHFGSAAELQMALAAHMGANICRGIADAVLATRAGTGTVRSLVDLTFDAFGREGGGQLAAWMLQSGDERALDPIVEAVHDLVDQLHNQGTDVMRPMTQTLVLLALGDALMGGPLASSLQLPRTTARDMAEAMLAKALAEQR